MNTFDLETVKNFAKICYLSYKSDQDISGGLRPMGYELFHIFDSKDNDVQGFIAEGRNSILVVFRGTDSLKDVLTDLNIFLTPYPKSRCPFFKPRVHLGFLRAFQSIEKELYRKIDELRSSRPSLKSFEISGFSMGGSLGAIAALSLKKKYQFPTSFIAFGMPRSGNRWFVRKFRKEMDSSFNILNDRDIIGQVPPKSLGYRHLKTHVLIDDNERLIFEPKFFEKLESSLESVVEVLTTLSLDAHMINNYIEVLDNLNSA